MWVRIARGREGVELALAFLHRPSSLLPRTYHAHLETLAVCGMHIYLLHIAFLRSAQLLPLAGSTPPRCSSHRFAPKHRRPQTSSVNPGSASEVSSLSTMLFLYPAPPSLVSVGLARPS